MSRHNARELQQWVFANADRPITLEEVEKALDWPRASVNAGLVRMVKKYPDQMERIQRGVYRWSSTAVEQPASGTLVTEMLVTVVRRRDDGKMLVRDDNTSELYVMEPFEF